MTHPQDDLAAWRTTDDDLAALFATDTDLAEWDRLHAARAHHASLVAEADRRGLVSRRRALFLQGRAPRRPKRYFCDRDDDDPPPPEAA